MILLHPSPRNSVSSASKVIHSYPSHKSYRTKPYSLPSALSVPLSVTLAAFLLTACATAQKPTAHGILSDPTDAVLTAKLTHFDYRKNLESAVRGEPSGLHALFKFTASESFVGAGADDHCRTLHELLQLLGDQAFSRELSKESSRVRIAVVAALEYDWAYPGWKS